MKFRLCVMAGILGIAVVAGVFEALSSARKGEVEKEKEEGNAAAPEGGNCDGL